MIHKYTREINSSGLVFYVFLHMLTVCFLEFVQNLHIKYEKTKKGR